jgi:hypothetical protein
MRLPEVAARLRELAIALGLLAVGVAISSLLRTNAEAYQLGTASEVNWFNYGKAFYPQYLDRVLQIYENEYENDRTNAGAALNGGDFAERKNYLKYYQTFDPPGLQDDRVIQNRVDRTLEVYSKIKRQRDQAGDPGKQEFFDKLLRLTFPKDVLISRVVSPAGRIGPSPLMKNARAYMLWDLYQTQIPGLSAPTLQSLPATPPRESLR